MPEVQSEPFDSEVSQALVRELLADLASRYDGDAGAGADPEAEDFLVWLVASEGDAALGCGGICHFGDDEAELRRLYVGPAARGRGVGRLLLAELERAARERGYRRLRLETGVAQPEAVGLYGAAGYERVPCWGPYAGDPNSVCFAKDLKT